MKNAEDKIEIILAQWQTCVEMANSISQRRDTMNNIFVTLNLAIIAAISITWNMKFLVYPCCRNCCLCYLVVVY